MSTKVSILIVDDDSNLRKTLSRILRARGYATVGAAKGKTALAKGKKEKPAVALIDLKLPDMSGLELVKEIKRHSPNTECIVLTGYASQASAIEAVNLGAYSYVQKPYDTEQLLVTIHRAIEKREAKEALEQRATQLAMVNQVARQAASILDLDQLLQEVVTAIQQSFNYHNVALSLLDDAGELEVLAIAGGFADMIPPGYRQAVGEGIAGWVAETGQPLLANDVSQEPRYIPGFLEEPLTKAALCVPLKLADQVIGLLDIQSTQLDTFDEIDLMAMETLADQLAVAIENARLYQETARRLEETETLGTVTTALTRSLDLDQVLQSIVDSATRLIPAGTGGVIHLVDEEAGKLIPQATSAPEVKIKERYLEMSVGEGIAGLVVQEKRLINVPNVEDDPRFLAVDATSPKKSLLAVPLMLDGDCIGTLSLNGARVDAFSADDERLLTTLAAQAAVAVQNARLHQEVQRRLEELTFLNRVGRAVTSSLDLEQILTTVMEETALVLGTEAGSILLLDEERRELVFEAAVGPRSEKVKGLRVPLGQGIAGWVAREGQPLLVLDVREDPRFYSGVDEATGFITKSLLAVPLKVRGKVIGVIEAANKTEGDFSQADVALLSSMARWAAIAIENAQLFTETQWRFEEVAALHDVSLDITAHLEMPELLRSIVERAVKLLRADAGSIYLYDSEREELRVVVGYDYNEKYVGVTLKPGEGMAGKVFQTREPLIVDDYRIWEGRASVYEADQPFTAVLEVPLKWQKRVIGVLGINAEVQKRTFNQDDVWLATLFANQAAIAIENARLFEQAQREIAERKRAGEAVKKHRGDLQRLSAQLINAQEAERKRISQELHDEMGQALTAMSINLAAVEKELPPELAPTVRERLAETRWLADHTLDQVRELSLDLRPSLLDDLGLVPTLRWYVNRYAERLNIEVELEAIDLEERLAAEMETGLYRVVQEALTNVARHAQANRVHLRLERKESTVVALIEDDGQGFDAREIAGHEAWERGAGLLGMRERVASLGGSFSIRSRPGQGTRLTIEIPLRQ